MSFITSSKSYHCSKSCIQPTVLNVSEQEINAQIRPERNGVALHRRAESVNKFVDG